jgi:hypothetical protein
VVGDVKVVWVGRANLMLLLLLLLPVLCGLGGASLRGGSERFDGWRVSEVEMG